MFPVSILRIIVPPAGDTIVSFVTSADKTLPLQSWSWPGLGEVIRYLLVRCLSPAPRNVLQRSILGFLVAVAHRINDATRESFILPHTNAMAPFHSSLFQWVVAQHGHHTRMTIALWHRLPSPLWEWQGLKVSTTGNSGYTPDVLLARRLPHPSIQDTFFFSFLPDVDKQSHTSSA